MTGTFNRDINLKFAIIACLQGKGHYLAEAKKIKEESMQRGEQGNRAAKEEGIGERGNRAAKEASYDGSRDAVYQYYKQLEIPQEHLDLITDFNARKSNECYQLISNDWDLADERFSIDSLDGIEELRNLQSIATDLLGLRNPNLNQLLKCKKLKKVTFDSLYYAGLSIDAKRTIGSLKKKKIEISVISFN